MEEEAKRCTTCGEAKPLGEFRLGGVRPNGKRYRTSDCNSCHRAASAAYRAANLEACRQRELEYARSHAERKREVARRWYAENPERGKARARQRYAEKPEAVLADTMASRARKAGAPVVEVFAREEIILRDQGTCHVCGEPVNPAELHLDHVIPLAKGGPHTRENVKVSHARCNLARRFAPDGQAPLEDVT